MKNVVTTDRGPKPIGPYSQAIKANGFIYLSGQVALDPKTGEIVGAEIRQQTERVLEIHLLDFDHEIYGKDVEVRFVRYLRPEQKFENLDALTRQIEFDVQQARKLCIT